jgi:hypothetical protein
VFSSPFPSCIVVWSILIVSIGEELQRTERFNCLDRLIDAEVVIARHRHKGHPKNQKHREIRPRSSEGGGGEGEGEGDERRTNSLPYMLF